MNWPDILCMAAVLGAAAWALARIFRRQRGGKCTGCVCGCPKRRSGSCSAGKGRDGREKN